MSPGVTSISSVSPSVPVIASMMIRFGPPYSQGFGPVCNCTASRDREAGAEAELKLAETPAILRMPSGYIQQSPWLTIANKQLELMARYMTELGLTPASRSRLAVQLQTGPKPWEYGGPTRIILEAKTGTKGGAELIDGMPANIVIAQNDSEF